MKARSEARAKLMEEQEKQKEEAARTVQERRAQALRALEDFTRKQMRPSSTSTQGKSGKTDSAVKKQKSMRKKTTVGLQAEEKDSTLTLVPSPQEKPKIPPLDLTSGKENGLLLQAANQLDLQRPLPTVKIARKATNTTGGSAKPRQRSATETLAQAAKARPQRRSLTPSAIAGADAEPLQKKSSARRRSMLPSTSASLSALVAAAEISTDHDIAASAPVSTEVSMESCTPSAASTNTSTVTLASSAGVNKSVKKRRVSIAEAGFAQPTIAARMRMAATAGNNHETEKAEAIIERRRKRSASLSAGVIAGLGLPAQAITSSGATTNPFGGEKRAVDKRPTGTCVQAPPVVTDQRLEKRRKAREERELMKMRMKITASMERGRSPASSRIAAPVAPRSDASAARERLNPKRDASRKATPPSSAEKPRTRVANGTSLQSQQPHSKERKKRYESILPKDLSSLSFSLDEKDMASTSQDAKMKEGEVGADADDGPKMINGVDQKAEELNELMLSHYTEDEATDSDDDTLAYERGEGETGQRVYSKESADGNESGDKQEETNDEGRDKTGYHQEEEDAGVWMEWKLRVCAAVGHRLESVESEELLWDVVDEALAYVLPNPAYQPSTPTEEATLASLVHKKITDWMSYGKGRDDVDAMLRAELTEKHERWEEVERREMLQLAESLGLWREEARLPQQRYMMPGEAF